MRNVLSFWLLGFLFLLASIASGPARAYDVEICDGNPVSWDIDPVGGEFPAFRSSGFAAPVLAIASPVQIFNQQASAMAFDPFIQIGTPDDPLGINTVVDWGNHHSEMWMMGDDDFFNGAAARTSFWLSGCEIDEADLVFNVFLDWIDAEGLKSNTAGYGDIGESLDAQSAVVHELGHAAGFAHICTYYNTMGLTWKHHATNGDQALQYVGQDVAAGLLDIYGGGGGIPTEDVSVVHWKFLDCFLSQSGELYSRHQLTQLYDEEEEILEVVDPEETEPRYIAAAGQVIQAEFTFEHMGENDQLGVQVGYYYSEDGLITTLDEKIGETTVDITGNVPQTIAVTITLPEDLPQGDGFLGVIVDDEDAIWEFSEANNATYLPIRIDGVAKGPLFDEAGRAYEYAAKIVCGIQSDSDDMRLARGFYATTINIHNPGKDEAILFKKLALVYPPEEQVPGEILEIGEDLLQYDEALKTDCLDLRRSLFPDPDGFPAPYIEGFVVIQSTKSLDVTAVYSAAALDSAGEPGVHSSIDVEAVPERVVGADLQIDKSAEFFAFPVSDLFTYFAILYTVEVRNNGPVVATNVRVADQLTLTAANAVGVIIVLDEPIELPPGGAMENLTQITTTDVAFELALGDFAPATGRTARFWVLAPVYQIGTPPDVVLIDIAAVSSDEAELVEADNHVSVETQLLP